VTTLRVRPEADRDTDLAADFYAREADIDVALQFLAAVDQAYQQLVEQHRRRIYRRVREMVRHALGRLRVQP